MTWLQKLGFELEQGFQHSVLRVPLTNDSKWTELASAALVPVQSSDYGLVQWDEHTPPEWLEDIAELLTGMSLDEPSAGIEADRQDWTASRVAEDEQRDADAGARRTLTAVLHRPTGKLVALTLLVWRDFESGAVIQEDTFVARDHRGHGLGLAAKAANLQRLLVVHPNPKRIHTWNADENQWMLAINRRLGFEVETNSGEWQLKLADSSNA